MSIQWDMNIFFICGVNVCVARLGRDGIGIGWDGMWLEVGNLRKTPTGPPEVSQNLGWPRPSFPEVPELQSHPIQSNPISTKSFHKLPITVALDMFMKSMHIYVHIKYEWKFIEKKKQQIQSVTKTYIEFALVPLGSLEVSLIVSLILYSFVFG